MNKNRVFSNYDIALDTAEYLHEQSQEHIYIKTISYGRENKGKEYEVLLASEIKSFSNSKSLTKIY